MKLFAKKMDKKPFDTETFWGRFVTRLHFFWADHAYLRFGFTNAHWIGDKLVRTNQPWPFQLKWWKKAGIKTVITLRGGRGSFYYLEKWACEQLGLNFLDFGLTSRSLPTRAEILAAKELFETVEYPVLIHCKSGADRAGMMSVLYRHLHLGHPISEAKTELAARYLHFRTGHTGVLDYVFDLYNEKIEPTGVSFLEWVQSDAYDPVAIKKDFHAGWWGTLWADKILRRE